MTNRGRCQDFYGARSGLFEDFCGVIMTNSVNIRTRAAVLKRTENDTKTTTPKQPKTALKPRERRCFHSDRDSDRRKVL